MRVMADLARTYGHDELRISHEQNVIPSHVHKSDLPKLYAHFAAQIFATATSALRPISSPAPAWITAHSPTRSILIARNRDTFDELKLSTTLPTSKYRLHQRMWPSPWVTSASLALIVRAWKLPDHAWRDRTKLPLSGNAPGV
jgi:hypothetical protein